MDRAKLEMTAVFAFLQHMKTYLTASLFPDNVRRHLPFLSQPPAPRHLLENHLADRLFVDTHAIK
jgi:hypothetical protein